MERRTRVLATYYRNNVLRCWRCPRSWPAAFLAMPSCGEHIQALWRGPHLPVCGRRAVPALDRGGGAGGRRAVLAALAQRGLVESDGAGLWTVRRRARGGHGSSRSWPRSRCRRGALYLAIALLIRAAAGRSRKRPWRSAASSWHSADAAVWLQTRPILRPRAVRQFINLLRARTVLSVDATATWCSTSCGASRDGIVEQIRHSILQVTHGYRREAEAYAARATRNAAGQQREHQAVDHGDHGHGQLRRYPDGRLRERHREAHEAANRVHAKTRPG